MLRFDAATGFPDWLVGLDLDLPTTLARQGINALIAYYERVRVEDVVLADEGDMLLLQWGQVEGPDGSSGELNLTRQLMAFELDGAIWQLSLTYRFDEASVGAGDLWCDSLSGLPAFVASLKDSEPYRALADRRPIGVELRFEAG